MGNTGWPTRVGSGAEGRPQPIGARDNAIQANGGFRFTSLLGPALRETCRRRGGVPGLSLLLSAVASRSPLPAAPGKDCTSNRTFAGERLRRAVDPHELVNLARFWYLVAFDHAREEWRTFRLDRIGGTLSAGRRFVRRPAPPGGLAAHVARNRSPARDRHRAEIILHAHLDELRQRVPPAFGTLTAVDDRRTLLRTEGDWLGAIAIHVALIGVDF